MNSKALLLSAAITWLLSACGGAGGGSSDTPAVGSSPQPPTAVVKIDSSVPSATRTAITKINTPYESVPPGTNIDTSNILEGEQVEVFATDANGEILVGGLVSSSGTPASLAAESTAIALVSQIIRWTVEDYSSISAILAIKQASEFRVLAGLVTDAISGGQPPLQFPGVADSVILTATQVLTAIAPSTTASNTQDRKSILALAEERVKDLNLLCGYPIIGNCPLVLVAVAGPNGTVSGADVYNGTNINFSAYGWETDDAKRRIPTGFVNSSGESVVELKPDSIFNVSPTINKFPVNGNGNIWNLTIYRSTDDKRKDIIETIRYVWGIFLKETGVEDGDCLQRAVVTSLLKAPLEVVPTKPDDAFGEVRKALSQKETWESAWSVFYTCVEEKAPLWVGKKKAAATKFLSKNAKSIIPANTLTRATFIQETIQKIAKDIGEDKIATLKLRFRLAVSGVSLAAKSFFMYRYWDKAFTVGVCQATNPTTRELEISNCAATLELNSTSKTMLVGDNFTLTTRAKDGSGSLTLTPSKLKFTSSDPTEVYVTPTGGVLTALKRTTSPVTITVEEPITGAHGAMTVDVQAVSATIEVSPTSITLGESATLSWSSINSSACMATGDWSGAVGISGVRVITPSATGAHSYGINCTGPGGPAVSSIAVTVKSMGPEVKYSWVKFVNEYIDLSFSTKNETRFMSSPGAYIDENHRSAAIPRVGDILFDCDAIGSPLISPGDCWVRLMYHYSSTPSGASPFTYRADPKGSYITSYDVTLHRRRIVDVISDPNFKPPQSFGDIGSLTIFVHPSYCPSCPSMPNPPENSYGSLFEFSYYKYYWIRANAIINDSDGNGYDDNGEHDLRHKSKALVGR